VQVAACPLSAGKDEIFQHWIGCLQKEAADPGKIGFLAIAVHKTGDQGIQPASAAVKPLNCLHVDSKFADREPARFGQGFKVSPKPEQRLKLRHPRAARIVPQTACPSPEGFKPLLSLKQVENLAGEGIASG
jgi:hypothetical protein